jgi:hypothetical protein
MNKELELVLASIMLSIFLALIVLVIRTTSRRDPLAVDVNAKCPACGHRQGNLLMKVDEKGDTFIQHTCAICSAEFYEPTIVKAETWRAKATPQKS